MRKLLMLLAAIGALLLLASCAPKPPAVVEKPAAAPPTASPPRPPAEGVDLAEAAAIVPIADGPASPTRKALSQEPETRPCWATAEGGCAPPARPGFVAFVGTSSGAATSAGALLNAYQNAVETVAARRLAAAKDSSPEMREKARAWAYLASGVYDKNYLWMQDRWVQKWEERFRDRLRVYFRAFVLVYVPEEAIKGPIS